MGEDCFEKGDVESVDLTAENVDKIGELFPNCITEVKDDKGNFKRAVNFEALRQMLSPEAIAKDEYYEFTWVGKNASIAEANRPIRKILRPHPEESESVDWENTENLYIEGDNLDVLKLLQRSYLGKVKMIYIDPPYNRGKDLIYCDSSSRSKEEWDEISGAVDEEGKRLFKNTETNGRFHSDWCSMIYSRLLIARNLLREDGVIFISIDGYEISNLCQICDNIFNRSNLLHVCVWDLGTGTTAGHFTRSHEYILVYAKNKSSLRNFNAINNDPIDHGALKKISKANPASEITFPAGFPFEGDEAEFSGEIGGSEKEIIISEKMSFKNGVLTKPTTIKAGWGMKLQILEWISGKDTYDTKGQRVTKFYFNKNGILKYEKERGTYNPKSVISGFGSTKNGTDELKEIFGFSPIEFPKPVNLILYLLSFVTNVNDIVLDFFSGSATTAHAVMQLNAEDGGHRKFIMVQLQEPCAEDSEAFKAGYKNICEIGKERIRRAGAKIKSELVEKQKGQTTLDGKINEINPDDLDTGFRVLKLDDWNKKDVYKTNDETKQESLGSYIKNIEDDRTDLDLLFGCLIEAGLPLDKPIKSEEIEGFTVYTYNDWITACFGEKIPESAIRKIAELKPRKALFRDSSFTDSKDKINAGEIFKLISPDTKLKVI